MDEFGKYASFLTIFLLLFIGIIVLGHYLEEMVLHQNNDLQWSNANANIETTLKSISDPSLFDDPNTAQYMAADWMIDQNYTNTTLIITQRYVLAVLYYSTLGDLFWLECMANWTEINDADAATTPCISYAKNYTNTTTNITETSDEVKYPYLSGISECDWYGSTCNSTTGRILQLTIQKNNLDGTIPTELSRFQGLNKFDLSSNDLYGPIPFKYITKISSLKFIDLHDNYLGGKINIPSDNTLYGSLEELLLNDNVLTSTIPTTISTLVKLQTLDLSNNSLVGTIPYDIDKITDLKRIELSSNYFRGTIPSSIGYNVFLCKPFFYSILFCIFSQMWKKIITFFSNFFLKMHIAYPDYATFHFNNFTGTMPLEICERNVTFLSSDCEDDTAVGYVACACCTECCSNATRTCTKNTDSVVTRDLGIL